MHGQHFPSLVSALIVRVVYGALLLCLSVDGTINAARAYRLLHRLELDRRNN